METNQFEIVLAKHQQAMEILIEDFNARLSVLKQNHLSRHIALLKQQSVARHKQCKKDYEEERQKIQDRKNGQTSSLVLGVYEKAEESLQRRYTADLVFIKEFCEDSVEILRKM